MPEDADMKHINENCVVSRYEHSKACSSSYWDRSGTKVLTTSYDDQIRGEFGRLEPVTIRADFSRLSVFDINPRQLGQYVGKDLVPSLKMAVSRSSPLPLFEKSLSLSLPNSTTARVCRLLLTLFCFPHADFDLALLTAGAYVSVFRAHWSTCPTLPLHVVVANMDRTLDVLGPYHSPRPGKSAVQQIVVQLTDDVITAVPAVTATHPTREGRLVGGNSSGKISFYAPPDEPIEAEE